MRRLNAGEEHGASEDKQQEMVLNLTPGPYFLSEMLAADISLTNHTNKTYYVGIPFGASECGYATGIIMTGGGAPHYNIPIVTQHSCPASSSATALKPGQTLTARKYLPLTDSGQLTLTAETSFLTRKVDSCTCTGYRVKISMMQDPQVPATSDGKTFRRIK